MARRNISQGKLAEMLGWKQQGVSRRMTGKTAWKVSELIDVATVLNVPLSDLIDELEQAS
jgi:hypothetical protein